MRHDPSDDGPRPRGRWIPKATHGAALLLGVMVWYALPVERSSDDVAPAEASRRIRSREPAAQASAWVDATLASLRARDNAEQPENARPATMEEFLEESRKDAEKSWRERNDEIDQIIAKARTMRGLSDPAAAIRAAQRGNEAAMKTNWCSFSIGWTRILTRH